MVIYPVRSKYLLVSHGADMNSQGRYGDTALISAASKGRLSCDCVEYLVSHGEDVNIQNNDGYTALMLAGLNGHLSCVEYLVRCELPG